MGGRAQRSYNAVLHSSSCQQSNAFSHVHRNVLTNSAAPQLSRHTPHSPSNPPRAANAYTKAEDTRHTLPCRAQRDCYCPPVGRTDNHRDQQVQSRCPPCVRAFYLGDQMFSLTVMANRLYVRTRQTRPHNLHLHRPSSHCRSHTILYPEPLRQCG